MMLLSMAYFVHTENICSDGIPHRPRKDIFIYEPHSWFRELEGHNYVVSLSSDIEIYVKPIHNLSISVEALFAFIRFFPNHLVLLRWKQKLLVMYTVLNK